MPRKKAVFCHCVLKSLPADQLVAAAQVAVRENPANAPPLEHMAAAGLVALVADVMTPQHLAVLVSKYWSARGVDLTVSFLDNPPAALRDKILLRMNSWGAFSNVKFAWTQSGGQVRIARNERAYYSYLGTDILSIPRNQHTMMLGGFTLQTPEAEIDRVTKHETGHTIACPHEHQRRAIIEELDVEKTIALFRRTQGWSPEMVRQQVLTPLEEASILGTPEADQASIMCYEFPGSITKHGRPIVGGKDFSAADKAFAARLYPLSSLPPPSGNRRVVLEIEGEVQSVRIVEGG